MLLAIRRLPSRQREALMLRYYLDLDEAEIASSMRVGRGKVKSTISRALAALGRILKDRHLVTMGAWLQLRSGCCIRGKWEPRSGSA